MYAPSIKHRGVRQRARVGTKAYIWKLNDPLHVLLRDEEIQGFNSRLIFYNQIDHGFVRVPAVHSRDFIQAFSFVQRVKRIHGKRQEHDITRI